MILVDWQIKQKIELKEVVIDPFNPELINPSSLDVRLGNVFSWTTATPITGIVDPLDPSTFKTRTETRDIYLLGPGQMVLGCLMETITLPNNISVEIKGKSSLGRLFLSNSHWAGWVDPGWSGVITLELRNDSYFPIRLTTGMKIGQLLFYEHNSCARPYSKTGRYHNQDPGSGSKGI